MADEREYARQKALYELEMHASHFLTIPEITILVEDFADRYVECPSGDGSVTNEWSDYLLDIGGIANFRPYVDALKRSCQ